MLCEDMYCRIDGAHQVCDRCGNSELAVVVHIDTDYFFAQVEEREDPDLKSRPFGVQQNMEVAAVNYLARNFGLYNRISVKEALRRCPDLVLIRGDNGVNGMQRYRRASHGVLQVVMQCIDALLPSVPNWHGRPVETPSFDDIFVQFDVQMAAAWQQRGSKPTRPPRRRVCTRLPPAGRIMCGPKSRGRSG